MESKLHIHSEPKQNDIQVDQLDKLLLKNNHNMIIILFFYQDFFDVHIIIYVYNLGIS